ncbi:MAG TPA: hypothetical protein VFE60_22855 [Roseiarcus sp.]|nr:hypothetical protein [Roseiarcus sp.]
MRDQKLDELIAKLDATTGNASESNDDDVISRNRTVERGGDNPGRRGFEG